MRIRADIKFQRLEMKNLHAWLDANAAGWTYWGSVTMGDLTQERTRQIVSYNDATMDKMVQNGNAHLESTIHVTLPHEGAAMLCRLSWPGTQLFMPDRASLDSQ